MRIKFLAGLDHFVSLTNKIAKFCKNINGKFLGTVSTVIICCTIVSYLGTDALKNIPIVKSAYYDTIVANFPQFVNFLSADIGKVVFLILLLAVIICYLFRKLHRPFVLLMAHSTMGHDLSKLNDSFRKSFWIAKKSIGNQLPSQNASEDQVVDVIREQDKSFQEIRVNCWQSTVFYYGVAHTPLVSRLGYQWGQTKVIHFLHRFRPTEDEQEFKALPEYYVEEKMAFLHSDRLDEPNFSLQSEHLLVSIATTYPIKEEDLSYIDPTNTMIRYNIQVDRMGYDFFNSNQKIRSYADRIIDDLRKLVRERGIETIHFAISSSVPFTFYLAQQMNTNQFSKIIVYHFERGKYTWGIDVTESDARKSIKWAGLTEEQMD